MWRKDGGGASMNLGHGLILAVWYESIERLPYDAPAWNVSVFGKRLVSRSLTKVGAKRRAEHAARRWMQEALLRLSGSIHAPLR